MSEHPLVTKHRRGHDAFRSGDVQFLAELFADDTVWHWPGEGPFGGDFEGKEAVLEMLGRFGESADSLEMTDEDFLASDIRTASLSHMKLVRDGNTWEFDLCEIVRWRDGKVAEEWLLVDDQYAFDRAWL